MYGKATFIKVNLLRYDSFSKNIKVHQGHAFHGIFFPPCIVLVFLLLVEYHLKHMLKSQLSGIHINFRMCLDVSSHEW